MTTWNDELIGRLTALYNGGASASQIAPAMNNEFALGLTRNAVIGKVHRLDLSFGRPQRSKSPVVKLPPKPRRQAPHKSPLQIADEMMESAATDLPPDTSEFAVVFEQLRDPHCRYPIGTPGTEEFRYCGAEKMAEGPYCARHHRICYQRPQRITAEERLRRSRKARSNNSMRLTA